MRNDTPRPLISDPSGKIAAVPLLSACGMKAGRFFKLRGEDLVKLPRGSELFALPSRVPVAYDDGAESFLTPDAALSRRSRFAVAAFTPPGYAVTYNSPYLETGECRMLPLYSYAAAAFYKNGIYVAAVRVDKDPRHDLGLIDIGLVKKNIRRFRKIFPKNRLVRHLEGCALINNCPNAQNFFLSRYEAPLPISPLCNARCAGCISYQPGKAVPETQPRIKFCPTPEEIREIAVFHLAGVKDPVVSFGQGCEGEPLLRGDTAEKAIRLIRSETRRGVINMNTNGSKPEMVARLFDAGLDSIRVSLNSVREEYYMKYYRPAGYSFGDVMSSIRAAKERRGFVSINYLTMPGFTDSVGEFNALRKFIRRHRVDMLQMRNLNFDPLAYFRELDITNRGEELLGIKEIIETLKRDFPRLKIGYFNPTRRMLAQNRLSEL